MSARTALRAAAPLALLGLLGALPSLNEWAGPGPARAQVDDRPQAAKPASGGADAGPSEAEKAIRAVDEAYVRAYNRGDGKALAAQFAEDAEVEEADGGRYRGRDQIERRLAETFADRPGARMELEIESIRLLSPDVAQERGRSVVTPRQGAPVSLPYTALFVRRDGRWLIVGVREEADPLVRPHDRLTDLDWMVGDWVDEGADAEIRVACRWSEDGNFLTRTFTVRQRGKAVMGITQRIGWDPLAKQVRSWEFDTEGGFGQGRWSRDGDRWVVKHTGVRAEGLAASATHVLVRERPDRIRWTSIERSVGDAALPDGASYVMVRVPPAPGLGAEGEAPPSDPTRSPR